MTRCIRPGILAILLCTVLLPAHAAETDNQALQQQIQQLNKRIDELTSRIEQLEKHTAQETANTQAAASEAKPQGPWQQIKLGMDKDGIRALLGNPLSMKKGGIEYWYYSNQGLKGAYVKFVFGKVQQWKQP